MLFAVEKGSLLALVWETCSHGMWSLASRRAEGLAGLVAAGRLALAGEHGFQGSLRIALGPAIHNVEA